MRLLKIPFTILSLFLVFFLSPVNSDVENFGKSFLKDITLSVKEKILLDEFARRMRPRIRVPYMREEFFLVRWLRARNFNMEDAEQMLLNHLNWWDDNKMDTIEDEDWSDMDRHYKIWIEMEDKERRPTMYLNLGEWDIRKAAVTGNIERLMRHVANYFETITSRVRKLGDDNQNVSQAVLLMNVDEFNLVNHGCLQCISFVVRVVLMYENQFPGYANKILVVNTPAYAQVIVDAARQAFHPETKRVFRVYGKDKNQWQPVLDKYFDKSEIPLDLGGLKYLEGLEVDY